MTDKDGSGLTEREAKERICPIRSSSNTKKLCDANECMWWRWNVKNPHNMKDDVGRPVQKAAWTGFCGYVSART